MKKYISLILFTFSLWAGLSAQYSGGKWSLVTAKGTEFYAQTWATRVEFPQKFINENWKIGKHITDLHYGEGLWTVVMGYGTSYTSQIWATRQEFPMDYIQEKAASGYLVTELVYGKGQWAVVASRGTPYSEQLVKISRQFPEELIQDKSKEGFFVSHLSYGKGQWAVIFAKGEPQYQVFQKSRTYPKAWIQEQLNQDFELSSIAFGNGYWIVVMSQTPAYDCRLTVRNSFPKQSISKAWAEERNIVGLVYGDLSGPEFELQIEEQHPIASNQEHPGATPPAPEPPAIPPATGKPSLHTVYIMDTQDRSLGTGARNGLQALQDQFESAALFSGLEIREHIIRDDAFNRANVEQLIQNLHVGPSDVLVFYYFGHGFRYSDSPSVFPTCFIGKNGLDHPNKVGYSLSTIYDQLKTKGARLTLVFGESCNNNIGIPAPVDQLVTATPMSLSSPVKNKYRELFLNARGSMLVASSSVGQPSWATTTGGYFLDSFLDAFQYQISEGNPDQVSWENLIKDTQQRVIQLAQAKNKRQEPIFELDIQP